MKILLVFAVLLLINNGLLALDPGMKIIQTYQVDSILINGDMSIRKDVTLFYGSQMVN